MRVLERPMAPKKLLVNWAFCSSHSSIEFFSSDSSHVSGAWSRQKGEEEALGFVIDNTVFDGQDVAPEPPYWVLLRVVLGDPKRFNFSGRSRLRSLIQYAGKPSLSLASVTYFWRISSILWRAS
jgi:hypothetical protein